MIHATAFATTILCAFLAPATLLAGDIVFTRAELDAQLASASPIEQKSTAERLDDIRKRLAQPPGDPLTEFHLRRDVLALELPLHTEAVTVLQQLAERPSGVHVWHENEGHARVAERTLDAAAAARWVLRQSQVHATAHDLRTSKTSIAQLKATPDLLPDVALQSVKLATDAELPALATKLQQAMITGAAVENAVALIAERRGDAGLALQLVRHGNPQRVRTHLRKLHEHFPDRQRDLLTTAMSRPALAMHSVALLGLHAHEDWAWQLLNHALEDRELGTAAAATMARHADNERLGGLAQRLQESTHVARRAALALYLDSSTYARQLLAEHLAQHPGSELAEEIRVWLRD